MEQSTATHTRCSVTLTSPQCLVYGLESLTDQSGPSSAAPGNKPTAEAQEREERASENERREENVLSEN